jgi:hypothetical protein
LRNATLSKGDERIVLTVLLVLGGFLLWAVGKAAFYALLGGSSRSLVAHFFDGKPILARDVYRAALERVWALVGATIVVGLLILGAMVIAYLFLGFIGIFFVIILAKIAQSGSEIIRGVVAIVFTVVVVSTAAFFFFLVYCRIIYVPQILMVEGKGVFNSIGRSFSLAGGQLRRVAALVLFWIYVGWSLLLLLFLPLGYVSDWVTPFGAEHPPWYDIAWQTVGQLSEILLMPIFMIGCTLLYLDSRVRKEGFDVELLANRILARPPGAPPLYPFPTQLAASQLAPTWTAQESATTEAAPAPRRQKSFSTSILGLDDYIPAPAGPVPAGAAQPEPEVPPKSCQQCGAETNVEDRFCRICGSDFDQHYSQ